MSRLTAKTVFSGLVIAWRRAIWPTSRSPESVKATTEGVVRLPSEVGVTFGAPPFMTAQHDLVVPRSIPITFAMWGYLLRARCGAASASSSGKRELIIVLLTFNRWFGRNAHARGAEQPVVQGVPRGVLLDDFIGLPAGIGNLHHSLVMVGVEGSAPSCVEPAHPVPLEHVAGAPM